MSRQTQGAHAQSADVPVADDVALSLRGFGVTFAWTFGPDASRPSWESPAPGNR